MAQRRDVVGAKNLQMRVDGSVLFLYADLSTDCGASSSGKSVLISTSSGNKPIGKSGAFLGFNIFTKFIEKRDLSATATAALRASTFTEVGDGCQWRMEDGGTTLCVRIDFASVKKRLGASGKSMLLATTGGNKPIAATGLSCGLNCYHPADKPFDASQLAAGDAAEESLQVGQTRAMEGGFTVRYAADNALHVAFDFRAEDMADGHTATLPPCVVGDIKVAMYVAAPKASRTRTEPAVSSQRSSGGASTAPSAAGSPSSSQVTRTTSSGDLLLEDGRAEKVRNIAVTCTPVSTTESTRVPPSSQPDAYTIDIAFDPTLKLGYSASGKSVTVASTGGFQRAVDSQGRVVCRVSLNAYRPAAPLSDADVTATVKAVLGDKPKADLASLSFKAVLGEVSDTLGLNAAMQDTYKPKIKEAVVAFLRSEGAA